METSRIRTDAEGPRIYHPKPESPTAHYYGVENDGYDHNPFIDGLELVGRVGIFVAGLLIIPIAAPVYLLIRLARKVIGK